MADRLTRREVQCLRLAGRDLGNKQIAQALRISPSTVENHLTSAYAKLGTSDRRAAAEIVARTYPEITQLAPTPIAGGSRPAANDRALGDVVASAGSSVGFRWPLPAPPQRSWRLIGLILAFAALSGLVTGGLVLLVAGGIQSLAPAAPSNAVLALDNTSSSRTS